VQLCYSVVAFFITGKANFCNGPLQGKGEGAREGRREGEGKREGRGGGEGREGIKDAKEGREDMTVFQTRFAPMNGPTVLSSLHARAIDLY
jgi:hypothetical protein